MIKICSKCKISLPSDRFGKNKSMKDGLAHYCKDCIKPLNDAANAKRNQKEYYQRYKDKLTALRVENREYYIAYGKQYRIDNPEKVKAYAKQYKETHKAQSASHRAKRRAGKLQATVSWADSAKIQTYYDLARQLTKQTGIKHVVDHIIPLQNELVCGLHVENNLQVLTEVENCQKHNRFNPQIGCGT